MIDMLTAGETPTEIAIYDVNGRLVKRQTQQFTAEATMTTIDISDLAPSVYTVRVKNGEVNSSRRVVVNR
ncbi:MAG: T9SS type A sorting domain-containing protein [Saprospiraceae bacterium]|nr:T9SS type A sorting domain-containing protein [Saprospiraceae bacterium]